MDLRDAHKTVTLLASTVITADSTGTTSVRLPEHGNGIAFVLDVTAAATETNDTLEMFVQTMIDGTNWVDVVSFTEVLGDGGALRHIAKVSGSVAESMFENGAALAAGSVRNLIGDEWRVRYDITDPTGSNLSFTASVHAMVM